MRAAVGVPLYDGVVHLRAALGSLRAQDSGDVAVVVVDDSLSDEPGQIVQQEFAGRIQHYERNSERLGLVATWRRTFERARDLNPGLEYFAWGSDHDVWEPAWARELVAALDANPGTVLAYGMSDWIDDDGKTVRGPWSFETAGIESDTVRFTSTVRRMRAGDMVYGLFRARALERCGVFRRVLLPDRLLLAELSLEGEFRQVPRMLWHRRAPRRTQREPARQRAAHGRAPVSLMLPWSLQHAAAIAWNQGVLGTGRPGIRRSTGMWAAAHYLVLSPGFRAARALRRAFPPSRP